MKSNVKKYPVAFFLSDDLTSSFTINDLTCFARHFEKVILVTGNSHRIHLPENTERLDIFDDHYSTLSTLRSNFGSIIRIAVTEFFSTPKYLFYPGNFIREVSGLFRAHYKADVLQQFITKQGRSDFLMYSFWFNHWATVIAILKSRDAMHFGVTRAHGIDLFEDRIPNLKRIAFRWFHLKYINRIFSVSAAGSAYLEKKYPDFNAKVFISRLGTADQGINPFNTKAVFTLVSCAKIRNIKRIHLIPEILSHLNFPVKWIHIGGENKDDPTLPKLLVNVEQLKQRKQDVEIVFMGDLQEKDVFRTYLAGSINLFVSVSETEGLPVSIMEAISFGIPVMATDVGGCREIANAHTGVLISKDFDVKSVAEEITRFKNSEMNTADFRFGVRNFWENNFNAAQNFRHFIDLVETT